MKRNKKLFENLQIVGLFLVIVAISLVTFLHFDYLDTAPAVLAGFGAILATLGYSFNWLTKGPTSYVFWQNILGYGLMALLFYSIFNGHDQLFNWTSYLLAALGSLSAGYHLAKSIKKMTKADSRAELFSKSNVLMVSALVCFVVGIISYNRNDYGLIFIMLSIFLYLAWAAELKKENSQEEGDVAAERERK